MTFIEAWKDSLTLCKPQALKLIFLVTLNAMWQAVRALCRAWFLVPVVALCIFSVLIGSVIPALIAYGFTLAALLLAVRPSTYIKDLSYFKHYFFKLFLFFVQLLLWGIACTAFLVGWEYLFVPFGHIHSFFATTSFTFTPINYVATAPAYVAGLLIYAAHIIYLLYYAIFFFLDKVGTVYVASKKALILVQYNLPMILLYTGFMWCMRLGMQFLVMSPLLSMIVRLPFATEIWLVLFVSVELLLYLFSFALVSNIYTKRVHDQYSLYQ